jgi:hypothetical protein
MAVQRVELEMEAPVERVFELLELRDLARQGAGRQGRAAGLA